MSSSILSNALLVGCYKTLSRVVSELYYSSSDWLHHCLAPQDASSDWLQHCLVPRVAIVAGVGVGILSIVHGSGSGMTVYNALLSTAAALTCGTVVSKGLDAISVSRNGMPINFWIKIKESNQKKDSNAPAALVLQASHDHNSALSRLETQNLWFEIANKYFIVHQLISSWEMIRKEIREHNTQKHGRPLRLLIISAHGYPNEIHFGDESKVGSKAAYKKKMFVQLTLLVFPGISFFYHA
jgi:hypothetical protein